MYIFEMMWYDTKVLFAAFRKIKETYGDLAMKKLQVYMMMNIA